MMRCDKALYHVVPAFIRFIRAYAPALAQQFSRLTPRGRQASLQGAGIGLAPN